MLEEISELLPGYSFDLSLLIWPVVYSIIVVILFFILKSMIKRHNRKKQQLEMDKHIEVLFEKYSNILADKIVSKLSNNKPEEIVNVITNEKDI